MQTLEHWLFDRPYSIATAVTFGLLALGLGYIWEPLVFVPLVVLLGLLAYFAFITPKTCASCRGQGRIYIWSEQPHTKAANVCPNCGGSGKSRTRWSLRLRRQ